MRWEAQDGLYSSATQAAYNEAARPNPTGEIGELISCHILNSFCSSVAGEMGCRRRVRLSVQR
jgi:hypothetical protein